MNEVVFRVVDAFPEPAFSTLSAEVFSDYVPSELLTSVLKEEAATRAGSVGAVNAGDLRIAAFRGDRLVGWTFARTEGAAQFHMINSGVALAERRRGVYTELVRLTIQHARSRGHAAVVSRHAATNNAVIVAKLELGFVVSGFEYSEVYGPLVRLTCLLGDLRRTLHRTRSAPIRATQRNDG